MVMVEDLGLTIPTSFGPLVLISCVLTIPTSFGIVLTIPTSFDILCAHYPH